MPALPGATSIFGQNAVNLSPDSARVPVLQFLGQSPLGKVLITDRPGKTVDGRRADGGEFRVTRGREGPSVVHGRANFDASWETIENQPSGLLFEEVYESPVFGKILFGSVYGGREVSGQYGCDLLHFLG